MKTTLLAIAYCMLLISGTFAQSTKFITSGSIEFEKTANMYVIINRMFDKSNGVYSYDPVEQYKKTQPQFRTLKSMLLFNNNKTLFTPLTAEAAPFVTVIETPMADQINTVYTDLAANTGITQKTFYETTFLVKDSLRKINWKITDETREIAGYTCRRANALVLDSVYVVAFYTDKIHVSGGPESFTGLPGMILELALPHENVIWRATRVTDGGIVPADISPPKKGKPVTNKELFETLRSTWKNRDDVYHISLLMKAYLL
jgi:GLPGLI family protein